ncbi:MAG: phosphate signaling complex protein PhoU [Anaerolineae bacterium]|jgi:phosphate transport system protein|nr:phosphate signaling complex protein PhoU [Anaerolineae bacterium]
MLRKTLDRKLRELQDQILLLGNMVEQTTLKIVDALKNRDIIAAKKIFLGDDEINSRRYAIENAIVIVMATHQPFAHDLRLLVGMLEINTELERMGDYSKGIAKIILQLDKEEVWIPFDELQKMAELGVEMLHKALGAFIAEDVSRASTIPLEDDRVDLIYESIYRELIHKMVDNPDKVDLLNYSLWIAHNLERFADRVTNICERTVYIATGETIETASDDDEVLLP